MDYESNGIVLELWIDPWKKNMKKSINYNYENVDRHKPDNRFHANY